MIPAFVKIHSFINALKDDEVIEISKKASYMGVRQEYHSADVARVLPAS